MSRKQSSKMFTTCYLFTTTHLGRINQGKFLRQKNSKAWCREPLILSGQLHIPYVKHYSTLAHTGSCGGKPFQLVNANGLTDSEHLHDIPSVWWETEHWWESHWETDMKKTDKREEDSADGYENDPDVLKWKVKISVPLFSSLYQIKCLPQKCSMATICQHCVPYHLLFQGEGETAYKNYIIHPFNQMPLPNMTMTSG